MRMILLISVFASLFASNHANAAARFWVNGGTGNWNSTTNWSATSGGASGVSFPTSADDVTFDVSGNSNCTVNVASAAKSVIWTAGYTATLTMTNTLTVTANITLGANMVIAGAGGLDTSATAAILTSNGKVWPNTLSVHFNSYTLADNWTVGNLSVPGGNATLNGNTLYINGSLTATLPTVGTTNIVMQGTGTWSGAGNIGNNLTFSTAGTITISGSVSWGAAGKTLTYTTAGAMTVAGSTLTVAAAAVSMDTAGMTWTNLTLGATTITLVSDIHVSGNTLLNGNGTINGAYTLYTSGSSGAGGLAGSATLYFNGSGTWSTAGTMTINTTINPTGAMSITNLYWGGGAVTLTYSNSNGGTVTVSNPVTFASGTYNTSGITWNSVSFASIPTLTLTSDIVVGGNFTYTSTVNTLTLNTANGSSVKIAGNLLVTSTTGGLLGTANIVMNGTGTISMPNVTSGYIKNNLEINTAGTITLSGPINYSTGILKYTAAGNVIATGSTLNLTSTSPPLILTVNVANLTLGAVTTTVNTTFNGTNGFSMTSFTDTTAGTTLTLQAGKTYTVTSALTLVGTPTSQILVASSDHATPTQAKLNLSANAASEVFYTSPTDIDSSGGITIWDFGRLLPSTNPITLTNTLNWNGFTYPATKAYTF